MRYKELLLESVDIDTWYHGSPSPISKFSLDKIGQASFLEFGPGVYLTSDKEDAKRYGNFIHTCKIKLPKSKALPDKKRFGYSDVYSLISHPTSEIHDENVWSDWGETKQKAITTATKNIFQSYKPNNYKEMLWSVWGDFYKNNSNQFLEQINQKYHGFILDKSVCHHFICFAPEKIKIISVEQI